MIGELLSAMRLSGGVFLDAELRGQWAISASFPAEVCSQFFPVHGSLISYHFVREGELMAETDGAGPERLVPGSILLFPHNHDHRLSNAAMPPVQASEYVMPPRGDGPARLRFGEGEPVVRLYCGFLSSTSHRNPLLDQLPPMLAVTPNDAQRAWLNASFDFAANGAQADPAMIGKLAELMFAEGVRLYFEGSDGGHRLAAALADPHLARALTFIHANYSRDLAVEEIAREAGLSRTVLGERFCAALGEPPMRYCARYRMRKAADLLEQGSSAAEAGFAVGFGSEAAFARAFKREYGQPPGSWRRSIRAA